MIKLLAICFTLPIILSLIFTPFVMRIAKLVGAIDKPDERKIHKIPMPRLGGLSIFVSFILTFTVINVLLPEYNFSEFLRLHNWSIITISLLTILAIGVCDDIWILKPGQKFLAQFFAGSLAYFAGFRFASLSIPFTQGVLDLRILSYPITVLWVIGITNAFNLIDGLDGLASGIAMIASLTVSVIAIVHHDIATATIGFVLAGSLIGFLRYNFNPAKIFLGDSGSLFLGFILSIISIQSSTKGSTTFSIIIPLLALGLPIMDTTMAMLRRVLNWFLPDQSKAVSFVSKLHSMFLPDKRHIHHQLLSFGFSQKKAVTILYSVSFLFGLCAILVTAGSLNSSMIIILVGIAGTIAARKLGYKEIAIIKNGILLKFYRFAFIKHFRFQVCLDIISILAAFYLSAMFSSSINYIQSGRRYFILTLIAVGIVQIISFIIGGLYKHKTPLLGLGDFMQIVKSALIAVLIVAGTLSFMPFISIQAHFGIFALLDFYFLITLVAGSRITFHALNFVFNKESKNGKKVIIYGADPRGLVILQALLNFNKNKAAPVGFLDDDPDLEGKYLNGYPVFGGHWKLEGLLRKNAADEIIIAKDNINIKVYGRIKKLASRYNIPVRISKIRFKPAHEIRNKSDEIILSERKLINSELV